MVKHLRNNVAFRLSPGTIMVPETDGSHGAQFLPTLAPFETHLQTNEVKMEPVKMCSPMDIDWLAVSTALDLTNQVFNF